MKRILISCCVAAELLSAGNIASAQFVVPPGFNPLLNPLPPAPPPLPKISVPQVPQIDEPRQPNYQPTPQPSFGDRVTTCLSEGAAAGLRSGNLDAFSRSCANQRG